MEPISFEVGGKTIHFFKEKVNSKSLEICKSQLRDLVLLDLKNVSTTFFERIRVVSTDFFSMVKCINDNNKRTDTDCFCLFNNSLKKIENKNLSDFILRVCSGDSFYREKFSVLCETPNFILTNSTPSKIYYYLWLLIPSFLLGLFFLIRWKKNNASQQLSESTIDAPRKENVSLLDCYSFKLLIHSKLFHSFISIKKIN